MTTVDVPPGALLCFYTDGLVERRGSALDVGVKRLCGALVAGPVESVCASVMAQLIGGEAPGDDVALLVIRRQASAGNGPLELVMPALPGSLKTIRDAMRGWLLAVGRARGWLLICSLRWVRPAPMWSSMLTDGRVAWWRCI